MKFHALALCMAGTVAACPVMAQKTQRAPGTQPAPTRPETTTPQRGTQVQPETPTPPETRTQPEFRTRPETEVRPETTSPQRGTQMQPETQMQGDTSRRRQRREGMMTTRDGAFVRIREWPYWRTNLYLDMPTTEEVAARVREIDELNRKEAAELHALAAHAAAGGYQNVSAVYEYMARDHEQGAQLAETWLASNRFELPPPAVVTVATDVPPERTVDVVLQEEAQMFNEALEQRKNEPSATVRGLWLVTAATSLRNISLLRALNRDVGFGRRTASAYLRGLMDDQTLAAADETWITTAMREDEEYFQSIAPPPAAVAVIIPVPPAPEVTPPAPQPVVVERVIERVIERPVIVERRVIVPAPRAAVAGRRQMMRARGRRPAR